jgi:hypothetical protein
MGSGCRPVVIQVVAFSKQLLSRVLGKTSETAEQNANGALPGEGDGYTRAGTHKLG